MHYSLEGSNMSKLAKKPKKRKGIYERNDSKYEVPSSDKSDIIYGEVGKKLPGERKGYNV